MLLQQKIIMNLLVLILLFPIVLAIHNADEYFRCDEFIRAYHGKFAARFITRPVVRNAMVLLTITATTMGLLTWIYRSQVLVEISIVAIFALMLNAVSHILMSLKRRSRTPGTLSAVVLVLPYSAVVIATLRLTLGMPWISMLRFAALGFITTPVAVVLFLFLGYLFFWLANLHVA